MIPVCEQIIKIRKAAGLSQADIAAFLGKTPGAICNYEKGRRPIRATDFEKLKQLVPNEDTTTPSRREGDKGIF